MPGKDTKGWLGEVQEGQSPSWGAAKRPLAAERSGAAPLFMEKRISE